MEEPENHDAVASILYRDPVVSLLFGFGLFTILFLSLAIAIFHRSGNAELLRPALLPTGAFAIVGAVTGLVRGLQSGRATKRRRTLGERSSPIADFHTLVATSANGCCTARVS